MTKVYKLTTQDNKTRKGQSNECTWGPGVTHNGTGKGDLCGPGYIHAYLSPELAVLFNPIHANLAYPKLWECETKVAKNDKDLKVGGISLTTLREIPLPTCSNEQRIVFAILCAEKVFGGKSKLWDKWAKDYLSGKDRTDNATGAAYAAAYAEVYAEVYAAAYAADRSATYAAREAVYAARAATDTAYAAARAAAYAAYAAVTKLDLVAIAKQALSS